MLSQLRMIFFVGILLTAVLTAIYANTNVPFIHEASATLTMADRKTIPVGNWHMLIGVAARGAADELLPFKQMYNLQPYEEFQKLFVPDGFNVMALVLNSGEGDGTVCWDTKLQGWRRDPNSNFDLYINTAKNAGMILVGEFLVGGMANQTLARAHPDWRQRREDGTANEYMGPLLCSNSPFWEDYLLPLYKEFFEKYGQEIQGFVFWEGPPTNCWCDWCKRAFAESGQTDFRKWQHQNALRKWRELAQTVRSTGWKGRLIGGGWAAFEWEEVMWDTTLGGRTMFYNYPEVAAFRSGCIDVIMPELYTHNPNWVGSYRREDAHYVYRSLMYERSIFGENIIPNVELFWDGRTMTPDELYRWLLEVWCAGYNSYSVVSEDKLYWESYSQDQIRYRQKHREIFHTFNQLPTFGRPWLNFQFVVPFDIERFLVVAEQHELPRVGYGAERFSLQEIDGRRCLLPRCEPKVPTPELILTLEPGKTSRIRLSYFDRGTGSVELEIGSGGHEGQDAHLLGTIKLTGEERFKCFSFDLQPETLRALQDRDTRRPGKQVALTLNTPEDVPSSGMPGIQSIVVLDSSGEILCELLPGESQNLWSWYVGEVSQLFKSVDRTLCGGALVGDQLTDLAEESLYGITASDIPRILLLPERATKPDIPDAWNVKAIRIKSWENLDKYAPEIIDFIKPHLRHSVKRKSPLVYVNWNRDDCGKTYISVINHGGEPGSAWVELESKKRNVKTVIDFQKTVGEKTKWTVNDGSLDVKLSPFAGVTFKVTE